MARSVAPVSARPEGSMSSSRGSDVFRTSVGSVPKAVALVGTEEAGDSTFDCDDAAGAANAAAGGAVEAAAAVVSGFENDAAGVVICGGAICGGAIGGTVAEGVDICGAGKGSVFGAGVGEGDAGGVVI